MLHVLYYVTLVFCTTSTETCFMKIHLPEYNISNIMGSTGFPPNTDRQGPLESYNNIVYGKSYRERLSKTKLNRQGDDTEATRLAPKYSKSRNPTDFCYSSSSLQLTSPPLPRVEVAIPESLRLLILR